MDYAFEVHLGNAVPCAAGSPMHLYREKLMTALNAGEQLTLDGRPAIACGATRPFALVRSFDGLMQVEYAWDTLARLAAKGRRNL